jgi:uncharacterized protein (TIGR02266 family)
MPQSEESGFPAEQTSQRRALRAPMIVEKIPCEDTQKTFFGYAKNISRGGLFIATVKPREPGEKFIIEMTLPMPESLNFRCEGEVIWKRHFVRKGGFEPGMGLRFIDLPEETGNRIDRWVQAQAANDLK